MKVVGIETKRMKLENAWHYVDSEVVGMVESRNPQLLVLPEKWVSDTLSWSEYEEVVRQFESVSASHGSLVVPGSFAVKMKDGSARNISPVIHNGKLVGIQPKISLFRNEANELLGGERMEVFSAGDIRLAVEVCYDLDFPYFTKNVARRGARVIVNPSLIPLDFQDMWHIYVSARALENRVAVISVNSASPEFGGNSVIAVPYRYQFGVKLRYFHSLNGIVEAQVDHSDFSELAEIRSREDPGCYSLSRNEETSS